MCMAIQSRRNFSKKKIAVATDHMTVTHQGGIKFVEFISEMSERPKP